MAEEIPSHIRVTWFSPTARYGHISIADSDYLSDMETCNMDIYLSITDSSLDPQAWFQTSSSEWRIAFSQNSHFPEIRTPL